MASKLIRDKKTKAIINTNEEELKQILIARKTSKQMAYYGTAIEQLQLEVAQLREDFKLVLEGKHV